MLDITILTIFPRIFDSFFSFGNPARAIQAGLVNVETVDLRDFTDDRHRTTDDYPYGGGTGMIMKPEPVVRAIRQVRGTKGDAKVIVMTPQGRVLTQSIAEDLAALKSILVVCGRYEGIDERIRAFADDEISIGDYVLSGGETGCMVLIDAVTRLVPGVLGADSHLYGESFYNGLLEHPQYTRPADFEGMAVPPVLLEGHHEKIRRWRRKESLARTLVRRPDLVKDRVWDREELELLEELRRETRLTELETEYGHIKDDRE